MSIYSKRNLVPQVSPTGDQVSEAWKVLAAFKMHVYQLLYKHDLTTPGTEKGYPFSIRFGNGEEMLPYLTIRYNAHTYRDGAHVPLAPDLYFTISAFRFDTPEKADATDRDILEKCRIIQECVRAEKKKISNMACCPLAEPRACVCTFSCSCVLHGEKCVGTHD